MISSVTKPGGAVVRAERTLGSLAEATQRARASVATPIHESLAGVERFDVAVRLIDASFLNRVGAASDPEEIETLIEAYMDTLNKEYQMAKDELDKASPSRAEVAALGLAVREMAVRLDGGMADFDERTDRYVEELGGVVRDSASEQLARELPRIEADLDRLAAERNDHLSAEVRDLFARAETDAAAHRASEAEAHDQLLRESQRRTEELATRVEAGLAQLGELNAQLAQATAELRDDARRFTRLATVVALLVTVVLVVLTFVLS